MKVLDLGKQKKRDVQDLVAGIGRLHEVVKSQAESKNVLVVVVRTKKRRRNDDQNWDVFGLGQFVRAGADAMADGGKALARGTKRATRRR